MYTKEVVTGHDNYRLRSNHDERFVKTDSPWKNTTGRI